MPRISACRAHNRLYAEQVFGKEYVAARIDCRQHQAQRVMNASVMTQMEEQAMRGLVNMGFAKSDAKRAIDGVVRVHPQGVEVKQMLREAIAALT